jgi:predicted nucleotidyltransferase
MIKPVGGLDKNLLEGIIRIITSHKKVDKIILYGSRAVNRFKRASDIDLAIAGSRWTADDIAVVKFNLDTFLPTALKFDVVLLDALKKKSLREDILEEGITVYS